MSCAITKLNKLQNTQKQQFTTQLQIFCEAGKNKNGIIAMHWAIPVNKHIPPMEDKIRYIPLQTTPVTNLKLVVHPLDTIMSCATP